MFGRRLTATLLPASVCTANGPRHELPHPPPLLVQPPGPLQRTAAPPECSPGDNTLVVNPQWDERFAPLKARPNVRSRLVKERCRTSNVPLPVDSTGQQRCLPYHILGRCNSNCGSKSDHHNNHVEQDQVTLFQWGEQHWVTE